MIPLSGSYHHYKREDIDHYHLGLDLRASRLGVERLKNSSFSRKRGSTLSTLITYVIFTEWTVTVHEFDKTHLCHYFNTVFASTYYKTGF